MPSPHWQTQYLRFSGACQVNNRKDFHCCLYSEEDGPIPTSEAVWNGKCHLEYLGETVQSYHLREIANPRTIELINEPPTEPTKNALEEIKREITQPGRFFIQQAAPFNVAVEFNHPINVSLKLILALTGLRASAVES